MKNPNVAFLIAKELKKNVKDIFMLTGYGAMYLNDAIQKVGINYFAARNEAAAPMMAEAYAKSKGTIGAVCVTAGPGATNAIPGLAEAYVDSCPIIIISGQVERKYTTQHYKNYKVRSLGIAEFSIPEAIKYLTKYSKTITNPYSCIYEVQKAIQISKSGRPGPVWLEIPLDIQSYEVKNIRKLKKFKPHYKKKKKFNKFKKISNLIKKSNRPLFIIGNGLKLSRSKKIFEKLNKNLNIPFFTSRFAIDIFPFSNEMNLGQCGIRGMPYSKEIIEESDLIIFLGCRLAPALCFGNPKNFAKKAKKILIDIDKQSINNPFMKFDKIIKEDLSIFLSNFIKFSTSTKIEKKSDWLKHCIKIKNIKKIVIKKNTSKPIDLYYFMNQLSVLGPKNSIFVNDAGSNYYVGGQVWNFEKNQIEVCSSTNAAMGVSVPLSIGAAIARKQNFVISVTGDGSIELNIQELKTISHYNLNIKTFVINNGGYASMRKWQDNIFKGNRLDTKEKTGVGTLNFKKISDAFELSYMIIDNPKEIKKKLQKIFSNKNPMLIEVVTNPNQKILGQL